MVGRSICHTASFKPFVFLSDNSAFSFRIIMNRFGFVVDLIEINRWHHYYHQDRHHHLHIAAMLRPTASPQNNFTLEPRKSQGKFNKPTDGHAEEQTFNGSDRAAMPPL